MASAAASVPGLFYFCLNPYSDDTGGIIKKDWRTPDMLKLQMLSMVRSTRVVWMAMSPSQPPSLPPHPPLIPPPPPPAPTSPYPILPPPPTILPPVRPPPQPCMPRPTLPSIVSSAIESSKVIVGAARHLPTPRTHTHAHEQLFGVDAISLSAFLFGVFVAVLLCLVGFVTIFDRIRQGPKDLISRCRRDVVRSSVRSRYHIEHVTHCVSANDDGEEHTSMFDAGDRNHCTAVEDAAITLDGMLSAIITKHAVTQPQSSPATPVQDSFFRSGANYAYGSL